MNWSTITDKKDSLIIQVMIFMKRDNKDFNNYLKVRWLKNLINSLLENRWIKHINLMRQNQKKF